ncbi:MAG: lipoyl synthase, partial [Deltaproteobacteria bacterium]|nr:lipoyl synthase [Deltaproteobacteria bacterium]
RYVPPEEFETYERRALGLGFRGAACGPLVRSSYRAGELYRQALGSVGGKVE